MDTLQRVWGFTSFRPGQQEAVEAVLSRRDSVVVFPTGSGKSLTYQLPAVQLPGMAVVVSPLLALMQDQVETLRELGVPVGCLSSMQSMAEQCDVEADARAGRLKLLYLSPERLLAEHTLSLLTACRLSFFVIDEAHCISHWGHDFRAEYRALGHLRDRFPSVPIHACTATATQAVRADMVDVLRLRDAIMLVGDFDRPNLLYRFRLRKQMRDQVKAILADHVGEAGIIYCIRRLDVDEMAAWLREQGLRVLPYHAGLSMLDRQRNQDAFVNERVDIMVATVAFGMGVDRSNVRFVIHTGMPKSVEHYQQEAGRGGRDSLPAECTLLFSPQDIMTWRSILPAHEHAKLQEMYRMARALVCRHRSLVTYFGQAWTQSRCDACDVCLNEQAVLPDSITVARKILSCVARLNQRFGARYVADVLKGARTSRITANGHDRLSTWGLLSAYDVHAIGDWIDQLVAAGFLIREADFSIIQLTASGTSLMRGDGAVDLTLPRKTPARRREQPVIPDANRRLFDALRLHRRTLAHARNVPPYVIFSDATLLEMAECRPLTIAAFRTIKGVGEYKAEQHGKYFTDFIAAWNDTAASSSSPDDSRVPAMVRGAV